MTAPALPALVDELTATWFSTVLGHEVTDATVVDRSSGTTGRARVALRGDPGVPATVFVKLAPFDEWQRSLVDTTGMGVAEARFYRDLAPEVPVRVPGVWYAQTAGPEYVMVLEDLTASGCRFPRPTDADIGERARDIVEQLAALHARYWESPRFGVGGDLEWLVERGTRGGGGGGSFIARAVDALAGELGNGLDGEFRRIADLYLARPADIVALWRTGPGTLVHGDAHLGNLFVDVEDGGRTGFLDWAVLCRAPGIRDVAYVLCNSVPTDVRASIERGLVDRWCALLAAGGIDIDPDEIWDEYRIHALYSWVSAASTAAMGSKWQPLSIGLGATRRATAALAHLGTADVIESRLG
ncbi:MAG: phosphotransferase [Acidimicrobiia bacterium]